MAEFLSDNLLLLNGGIALATAVLVLNAIARFLTREVDVHDLLVETAELKHEYQRRLEDMQQSDGSPAGEIASAGYVGPAEDQVAAAA